MIKSWNMTPRVQHLKMQQARLADAARVYNSVIGSHVQWNRDEREVAALCDMFYEVHSKLQRVDEEIRQLEAAEAMAHAKSAYSAQLGAREYDI